MIKFFVSFTPPRATHQMKKINFNTRRVYEPPAVKAARDEIMWNFSKFRIAEPLTGPLRLKTTWCFPVIQSKKSGQYKDTRPDTDNLNKLLKDCMTDLGFWKDDAQVCCEIIEKLWMEKPGIYVEIEQLPKFMEDN